MATELAKARVTELQVPMDCNGCVQKIKKAMHGVEGVYDVYIDVAQQKLTVIGRADPEKLVKAIKKTRKTATICSHTEHGEPGGPEPPPTEPGPPTSDAEAPPAEAASPTEPPNEAPPQETPTPEVKPSPEPRDVEEVHMVHHYPHGYGYRGHWNNYPRSGHEIRHEAPYYVTTHGYNTYRSSPSVSGYGYLQPPLQNTRYNGHEDYRDGYYQNRGGDGNQIISMFSDENPNACRIV